MLHPRPEMPNEVIREASPPRLSIGTDRHSGGCKAGPVPALCHPAYAGSVRRGRPADDLGTERAR